MFHQQIWLDTGSIQIEARITDKELVIDTVINSPIYYQAASFNERYSAVSKTRDTAAVNDFLLKSFKEHIDNPFSINVGFYYVMLNQNQKPSLLKLKTLTDQQGDKFRWFLVYTMVVDRMNKILTIERINPVNYSFFDRDSNKVKLSLTGADFYVLDFWFLTCVPCIQQHAEIKKKISQLKARGVELIGISIDSETKSWKEYLEKHGYTWQNYMQEQKTNITNDLSVTSFPTYIILNRSGDIVDTFNSFSDVLKKFEIKE